MSGALWMLAGAMLTAVAAWLLRLRERRRVMLRARQLSEYLEAVLCGSETALPRQEDELSLLEDELYKTVSELRLAKEQSQRERQQQADNLADIAHQLKTPITSMSLLTQLLAQEAQGETLDCVNRLDSQLERLERLTASLLTMSRLDAGSIVFTRMATPFAELAARATEPVEQAMRSRRQTLSVLGGELLVCCDPAWTAEALLNLIKNCSEHAPQGGQITAACVVTPLYVQLTVEDDGPGFDPGELQKLFLRFYRGKNAARESIGIGLALARSIVEGQDGVLRAENRREGGARFVARFYGMQQNGQAGT